MNILIDTPPQSVTVGDVVYPVTTDFRACLRTILAFEDPDLIPQEKQAIMLQNLFTDEIPHDLDGALSAAAWFLNCGNDPKDDDNSPRIFSFSKDASFIFAAFKQTHGVDMATADLHWWVFMALFMDLGADTTFCQLASLRKRIKTGKATKEEKAAAREMGELFDLDDSDDLTLEERETIARFEAALEEGKRNREQQKQTAV